MVSNHWLGDEAHVALDVGGRLIVAVAHQRVPARAGNVMPVGFKPGSMHLFDVSTGRALMHGGRRA